MNLRRLRLTMEPGAWRLFMARKRDKNFAPFREEILQRDGYTCQFCGFQAKDYQEVLNIDNNYKNNKMSNMVTACVFCSQCFFVESVGINHFGGGTLIHFPHLSQTELNALCHVLFCAIVNGTAYKDTAQNIFRDLKFGAKSLESHFGEGTSRPSIFGRLILSRESTDKSFMNELLANVRLLPSQAKFKTQIETWAAAAVTE